MWNHRNIERDIQGRWTTTLNRGTNTRRYNDPSWNRNEDQGQFYYIPEDLETWPTLTDQQVSLCQRGEPNVWRAKETPNNRPYVQGATRADDNVDIPDLRSLRFPNYPDWTNQQGQQTKNIGTIYGQNQYQTYRRPPLNGPTYKPTLRTGYPLRPQPPQRNILLPEYKERGYQIFKMTQLKHHLQNWRTLPQSIHLNITQTIQRIKLPLTTEQYTLKLYDLFEILEDDITRCSREHLRTQIHECHQSILQDPVPITTEVLAWSGYFLRSRFGENLPQHIKGILTNTTTELNKEINHLNKDQIKKPGSSSPKDNTITPTRIIQSSTSRTGDQTSMNNTTRNKHKILDKREDHKSGGDPDIEPDSEIDMTMVPTTSNTTKERVRTPEPKEKDHLTSSPIQTEPMEKIAVLAKISSTLPPPQTPKLKGKGPPAETSRKRNLRSNKIITNKVPNNKVRSTSDSTTDDEEYLAAKDGPDPAITSHLSDTDEDWRSSQPQDLGWRLNIKKQEIHKMNLSHPETGLKPKNIIIGDSNTRKFTHPPKDWCVLTIPGADTNTINELVDKNKFEDISNIILAYGINDRETHNPTIDVVLKKLISNPDHKILVVGVALPEVTMDHWRENIHNINGEFNKPKHPNYKYIPPLDQRLVQMEKDGIHYTEETATYTFINIINQVKSLNK